MSLEKRAIQRYERENKEQLDTIEKIVTVLNQPELFKLLTFRMNNFTDSQRNQYFNESLNKRNELQHEENMKRILELEAELEQKKINYQTREKQVSEYLENQNIDITSVSNTMKEQSVHVVGVNQAPATAQQQPVSKVPPTVGTVPNPNPIKVQSVAPTQKPNSNGVQTVSSQVQNVAPALNMNSTVAKQTQTQAPTKQVQNLGTANPSEGIAFRGNMENIKPPIVNIDNQ